MFEKIRELLLSDAVVSGEALIAKLELTAGEQVFATKVAESLLPLLAEQYANHRITMGLRPMALPAAVALVLVGAEAIAKVADNAEKSGEPPTSSVLSRPPCN